MDELLNVKGVGSKSLQLLNKLNIYSLEDLIMYYPYRYNVLKNTHLIEGNVIVDATIESNPLVYRYGKNKNRMTFRVNIENNVVNATIFNRAFLKTILTPGTSVIIEGTYDKTKNNLIVNNIRAGELNNKIIIEPIYHTTKGLTNNSINTFINNALKRVEIFEILPSTIVEKYNFIKREKALSVLHNPEDGEVLDNVINRFKYEELFLFMTKINYLKLNRTEELVGLSRDIMDEDINNFIDKLPFQLTNDQLTVTKEIIDDLNNAIRMNRLLQGDVGSGKTIVAFISMYANFLSGYQSVLMVPTEVLAKQHFNNLKELLKNYDIKIELLTSSTKNKEDIYEKLEFGDIDIIIGTHALFQDKVNFYNLGLVITDEQHRFGVNQRHKLESKGTMPDILYMSATPIPRTYAITIYGDMDISVIKEKPKNRQDIETIIKTNNEIKEVLELMYKELKENHQIYVVVPLIEETEEETNNVYNIKENLQKAFKNYTIDVMHGKMKDKEKVMNDFVSNKTNILVSTTVIEVGIDNPNATMIVIFNSDRFGLSQLHQLRGRVGRGEFKSTCILISDKEKERLNILTKTNDGFIISEEDFKLRGAGDLFGTDQSGDMKFQLANIKQDFDILLKAKEDSMNYLKENNFKANSYIKQTLENLNNLN